MTESHLDDETLSAAIDGQDAPATAHLAGCAACRSRSAALDAVRRAVGTPPAAAPATLADRAVAAAMAAYAEERADPRASDARAGDPGAGPRIAVVVPLRRPLEGPPDSFTSAGPAGRRRQRLPAWALGVAAALAAVLVAVPLLNRAPDDDAATVATGTAADRTTEGAGGVVVDGGDLGNQSDQLALGSVLTGAVGAGGSQYAAAPAAPGAAADDEPATDATGARASEPKALASGPPLEGGAGMSPTPQARPATPTPSVLSTADPAAIAACEEAAARDFGDRVGPLLYRATLRWQGTPAVLLAYQLADTSSKGPDHQAFVMALDDCRVLVAQGF